MLKVCYFTSKKSSDVRVFEKECTSLVNAGYEVYLVSPNAKDEVKKGVHIVGFPYKPKGLFQRNFSLPKLLYKKALSINADIYHFNDPACLHYGAKLKLKGKKVIFDSFEDHPLLIFEKKTIPSPVLYIISKIYTAYEYYYCRKFDAIISCYHWTQKRLEKTCKNNKLIFNFPVLTASITKFEDSTKPSLCYAGLFSEMWKIDNIVRSLAELGDIQFNLAGQGDNSYIDKLKNLEGWKKVNYIGLVKREDVHNIIYAKSRIGMVLLDYIPLCKGNIGNLSNNKFFEYMMAGLPIICTDFVLWKEIVEINKCGICVNPNSINEIVAAIKYLVDNPDIAKQMGENGRKLIEQKYNWKDEEKKLIDLYKTVLD
jgi:glycosyltransferase involved in cell wall biosynthesis